MPVVAVDTLEDRPYAEGREFDPVGRARIRRLVLRHEVDPAHTANATIVDLEVAERNAAGRVEFDHDVVLVEPEDPARRNGWVMVDVVNRGRATVPGYLNLDATPPLPPPPEPPAGDGHLLSKGWTIAHVGWQFDIVHPKLMGLRAPRLDISPAPTERVNYILNPVQATRRLSLNLPGHRAYDCADPEGAELAVRLPDGSTSVVPRDRWRFDETGQRIELPERFVPGAVYRCSYEATGAVVAGTGQLALRDVVPWLRAESGVDRAVLFGVSQCGRVVRQFLHDGCNADESGLQAYAAVMPVIAGARRGAFNARFGVPGSLPLGTDGLDGDPRYGALLEASDRAGVTPKLIALNTSTEYWRGDAALVHGDDHPAVRIHHVAGTQHSAGLIPQMFEDPYFGTKGRYGFNTVDYRPVLRALLHQLTQWCEGVHPSDDVVPSADELSTREAVLGWFARRGTETPVPDSFGLPAGPVPAVAEDGNELGSIRLPDVAAPLGAHAGWNLRHPDVGAPDRQLMLRGSTWWFDAPGERPALEEYLATCEGLIDDLTARRLLLPEDRQLVLDGAAARWHEAGAGGR